MYQLILNNSCVQLSCSARNQRHDKRGEIQMSQTAWESIHRGHEQFSDDSQGRQDFYVFGCSIMSAIFCRFEWW